jgi:hypothetical protein
MNSQFIAQVQKLGPPLFAAIGLAAAIGAALFNYASRAGIPTRAISQPAPNASAIDLPAFQANLKRDTILRNANLTTHFPDRPRLVVTLYTVQSGDSLFGIAEKFHLMPETLLWGNYQVLRDDPHRLRPGQTLKILPVDGTYYQWQAGDSLQAVADFFDVDMEEIVGWPGNDLDPGDLSVDPGSWLVVPGGKRALRTWFVPTIARGSAGVGEALGPGGCSGNYSEGAVGSGGFIWPTASHSLSGNNYWSGHLAIDINASSGETVWAADGGVIVYAGWSYGGYGNLVMIDHGNGWQTLYGHLSHTSVECGQNVTQGAILGNAGSTGNSTGPHLHFETRFQEGFVNPWFVLP